MSAEIAISFCLIFILSITFSVYYWTRFNGRVYFLLGGLSIAIWIASALFEIRSDTFDQKLFWTSMTWIGVGGVTSSYLFFVYEFLFGKTLKGLIPPSIMVLSSLFPALLGATSNYHGLFFGSESYLKEDGDYSYVVYDREVLWYIFSVVTHAYAVLALLLLSLAIFRSSRSFLPQAVTLLGAASIPLVFNVSYIFLDFRIYGYNFAPFSFLASYILLSGIIYLGRSFSIETVSSDMLFHQSKNPALVTDETSSVFSCNQAMKALCGFNQLTLKEMGEILRSNQLEEKIPELKLGDETFLINHLTIPAPLKFENFSSDIGSIYQLIDITHQKKIEEKFRNMSETDWLTRVSSRGYFMETLEATIKRTDLGLFILDMDYFKNINDQYGHDVGDQVLMRVGGALLDVSNGRQTVGRIGGEEFIIFRPMDNDESLREFAESLCEVIRKIELPVNSSRLTLTASVGGVLVPRDGDVSHALKLADQALYQAKEAGRNKFRIFPSSGAR